MRGPAAALRRLETREALLLAFFATFIVLAKAALRWHLHIPGHAMFATALFLLLARACVPRMGAATAVGLLAGLVCAALGMGKGGPLIAVKLVLPGLGGGRRCRTAALGPARDDARGDSRRRCGCVGFLSHSGGGAPRGSAGGNRRTARDTLGRDQGRLRCAGRMGRRRHHSAAPRSRNHRGYRRAADHGRRPAYEIEPCRSTRPGRTSRCTPPSTATRPLISTQSMPAGCWRGCS